MTAKTSVSKVLVIGFFTAAFLLPTTVHGIEVKKSINLGGGGGGGGGPVASGPAPRNPLTSAQQKALFDTVASDSEQFLAQESEKKSSGELYVDLDKASFSYVPKGGTVEAKLTAAEYKPKKDDPSAKGTPTGKKKALVFNYKVDGSKFTATEPPKWEDVEATETASAKKKK